VVFDRRKKNKPFKGEDQRLSPKVGPYHLPKGGKRYQFNGLIVYFNPKFNVWHVIKSSEPYWKNVVFEIIGIENEKIAINWALEYIKSEKTGK
jgi:hypothetical protein